ncbi:MAG: tRNA (5-methylaminomethyl-2-thiouridine)(34)-methyltransferase MnmD [Bacteroidales bacterium]
MERRLTKTGDGSHTIYIPELDEHYHSVNGAVAESEHIYIRAAFGYSDKNPVRVLEYGMGTGLNVLLTFMQAGECNREVYYHAIEKYPLSKTEFEMLNLSEYNMEIFGKIHEADWGTDVQISESFALYKECADFREAAPLGLFDVIYFDAFAPVVQPALWTVEIFTRVNELAAPGAVLTTYSSSGQVRRNMKQAGFTVQKLPGPPGKREIVRATKPVI